MSEATSEQSPPRWRTVWISDIHLGTPGCQAEALAEMLGRLHCDTLYLVGDIVDGWQLRRNWHWPAAHNQVVQRFLQLAQNGTRVIYVPGNHDDFARGYAALQFGGVEVQHEAIHELADGRRLWVIHGDHFDGVVQCAPWLAHLGDAAYTAALQLNQAFNALRAKLGLPYWSLSRFLKGQVKRALAYVQDFEQAVAREARARGLDGVVCGHIHQPCLREIDGIVYANDGDWVESLSALAEDASGRLQLLDFSALARVPQRRAAAAEAGPRPVPVPVPVPVPAPGWPGLPGVTPQPLWRQAGTPPEPATRRAAEARREAAPDLLQDGISQVLAAMATPDGSPRRAH